MQVNRFLLCLMMSVAATSRADVSLRYRAQVLEVVDGGTVVLTNRVFRGWPDWTDARIATSRLDAVSAPSLNQTEGLKARSALMERLRTENDVTVVDHLDGGESKGTWLFFGKDGACVNTWMVENGYVKSKEPQARALLSINQVSHAYDDMKLAHRRAKEQRRGIWALETLQNKPVDEDLEAFPVSKENDPHELKPNPVESAAESPFVVPNDRPMGDPPPSFFEMSSPPGRNWVWWSAGILVTMAFLGLVLTVKRRK